MDRKIRIANTSNQIYPQDELLHKHRYCETEEHRGKQRSGQGRTGQDRITGSLMKQDKIYHHSQQSYLRNQIQFTMIILIV